MVLGCEYRFNEIDKQVEVQSGNLTEELMAKIIVDKCLDDNKYMPIYVMLLQEIQDNDELRDLYLGMKEFNVKKIQSMLKLAGYQELSMDRYNYLTDMINSIILACGLLGIRESFKTNRYLLEEMFLSLLKKEE